MCPIPELGDDLIVSSGCELSVSLDASESSDPDDSSLNFQWVSLDGLSENLSNSNSSISTFSFPFISSSQIYQFAVTVDDSENFITDTISVTYLENSSPIADAGTDFTTCDAHFTISANNSYDEDWNGLSYSWSLLNGSLSFEGESTSELLVSSPIDLDEDTEYFFELEVTETIAGDQYCSDKDTIIVTVRENICPIAEAGKNRRIPKFNNSNVVLSAANSCLLYTSPSPRD